MSKKESYIKSSYDELVNKVSWPSWSELQSSSIVVAIASLIIALIVFLMDQFFGINSDKVTDGIVESPLWRGILGYFYEFIGNN
jgi:preprotein translocase subunit SecE